MDKKRVALTKQQFDSAVHNHGEAKVEYWFARELMPLLGYERWENFDKAISRAMESCETSGIEVIDHFREVTKMVSLGSGSKRSVKDYMLTRYACYLIAQNGDPKKEEIAFVKKQNILFFMFLLMDHVSNEKVKWKMWKKCVIM